MLSKIILLSGPKSSGKTTLANEISNFYGFELFKTSDYIKSKIKNSSIANLKMLQDEGDHFDNETHGRWVLDGIKAINQKDETIKGIVVDSVRIVDQIDAIRDQYWPNVLHIHLTAPKDDLLKRFNSREKLGMSVDINYEDIQQNPSEIRIEKLANTADLNIDTKRCTRYDVLTKALSFIDVSGANGRGYVDVIIGGQYGSEGKGQISAFLANEYDILVRVGGPNAGHSVIEKDGPYIHHQLPSGSRMNESAKLVLCAGMVLNLDKLKEEIRECGISENRLIIDHKAMIIADEDMENEKYLVNDIGSTGQGVGAATSRRIMGRGKGVKLARDYPALKPYLKDSTQFLYQAFKENKRVLLEGTQGTGLSLYHGEYPYVTSRDTTVAACLSEAGISPKWVRRVILVCRTYPIRVANPKDGSSGSLKQEIKWSEVAKRSGYSEEELIKTEKTSTTKRDRRVGEFEWDLLHKSSTLNGSTDIALTFVDYITKSNTEARRLEQLSEETINFIHEIERVSNTPVSLISNGFNKHSIIDRRIW